MSNHLCICGKSKIYPQCDETHEGSQWSCEAPEIVETELVISTSIELYNLAKLLAFKLDALVITEYHDKTVKRLIRLCTLSNPYPTPHVQADQTLNVAIDIPPELILKHKAEPVYPVTNLEPKDLYKSILQAVRTEQNWVLNHSQLSRITLKNKIFLSHAVVDQPRLHKLIHLMRVRYNLDVFVCSDSLALGSEWYSTIIDSLAESDLVIQVVTENTNKSTFCAFEAGYSLAAGLPLLLICYDQGVRPGAHLQHLQASELWKTKLIKPWLSQEELALAVVFEMLIKLFRDEDSL